MGADAKHFTLPLFFLLFLAAGSAQAQASEDGAAQAGDLNRRLIEQQQRATVCEVRSHRLEQQLADLEEQLAATRDALERLAGRNRSPEPIDEGSVETAQAPGSPIEVEELPEPTPDPAPPTPSAVSSAAKARPGGAASPTAATPLAPPSVEALALYDEGYTLFHEKRYGDAVSRFERYVELFPHTELTDNALFWIGECHYAREDFEAALEAFTETVARYPAGNKVADALLKAGKCLLSLGEREEARRTFEEVMARFPDAAAAAAAKELLAEPR